MNGCLATAAALCHTARMAAQIELVTIPPRSYVGVRRTVQQDGIAPACAEIFPRLWKHLMDNSVQPEGMPAVIYHTVDRGTGEFHIQPALFIASPLPQLDDDMSVGETPGGEVLTATHVGPYARLGETWHALFERAESMGRRVSKSSWEIYVDDPGRVEVDELRTEIFVPVDPA